MRANLSSALPMVAEPETPALVRTERYALHRQIAAGGMASVHLGRLLGPSGFGRTVAIKRLHPHLALDKDLVSMLLDEARIAARLRHPNVVHTIDIVHTDDEALLVMEYVHGVALSSLLKTAAMRDEPVPAPIAATVLCEVLRGLHAAHEAVDERGIPLAVVHRDVSPQNVLVGADGVARVVDFGIAKAAGRTQTTDDGRVKGKLAYMAPEQLAGGAVDRRTDVYAAAIVLWETLTCRALFAGPGGEVNVQKVMQYQPEAPSHRVRGLSAAYDDVVLRGLQREARYRYPTARHMALALERCGPMATASEVAAWVEDLAGEMLSERAAEVARVERTHVDEVRGAVPPQPTIDTTTSVAIERSAQATDPRSRPKGAIELSTVRLVAAGLFGLAVATAFLFSVRNPARVAASSGPAPRSTPTAAASGAVPLPVSATRPQMPITSVDPMSLPVASAVERSSAAGAGASPRTDRGATSGLVPNSRGIHTASSKPSSRSVLARPDGQLASAPAGPAAAVSAAAAAQKDCSQPYVIDADGVKHYKVDCL